MRRNYSSNEWSSVYPGEFELRLITGLPARARRWRAPKWPHKGLGTSRIGALVGILQQLCVSTTTTLRRSPMVSHSPYSPPMGLDVCQPRGLLLAAQLVTIYLMRRN